MSQWDKLIDQILTLNKNLRYEDLSKALIRIGYTAQQPGGGSSHVTFRKAGHDSITIPKTRTRMDIVYIKLVSDVIVKYFNEEE